MSRSSTDPSADRVVKIRIRPEVYEHFRLKGRRIENRRQPYQQIAWEVEQLVRQLSTSRHSDSEDNGGSAAC